MSDELPEPLTPPDCDLRKFRDMPLDVGRFRDSDLLTEEEPEAIVAAVLLWGAAWHQVPAASVPDNDRWLAKAAGYGRAIETWRKVRAGALRGFVLCSDGRLYNRTVAEKANAAWDSRLKYDWTKAADRHRKSQKDLPEKERTKFPDFDEWKLDRQISVDVPAEFHSHSGGTEKSTADTGHLADTTKATKKGEKTAKTENGGNSGGNQNDFQRNDTEIPLENALKGNDRNGNESIDKSPTDSSISDADDARPVLLPALIDQPDDAQIAFERHDTVRREFVPNARDVDFTPARKKQLTARLKDVGGLSGWDEVLNIIRGSPFLRGDTSRNGFVAVIDWITKPANLLKVREGNYDHDEQQPARQSRPRTLPRSPIDSIAASWGGRGTG